MTTGSRRPSPPPRWYTISYSISFMFRRKRLLVWSTLLFLATIAFTAAGYALSIELIDSLASGFLTDPPSPEGVWGWIKNKGWLLGQWLFILITRIVSFYLAFLIAYALTSPGYAFLSVAAEKLHTGDRFEPDDGLTLRNILIDIFEACKIALFGVLVTIVALMVNFLPGIGQGIVFLLYTYYSALMFVDYPSSRRRWSLSRKIYWIRQHGSTSFKIGVLPALVSMIPLLNIFLMSLIFPVMTVYSTLNFSAIELNNKH